VPGVSHEQVTRTIVQQTAAAVQTTLAEAVPVTGATATRTRPMAMITRPLAEAGRGQVFHTGDAFGAIRDVLSRSRSHDRLLPLSTGPNPGEPITAMKSRKPPTFFATVSPESPVFAEAAARVEQRFQQARPAGRVQKSRHPRVLGTRVRQRV